MKMRQMKAHMGNSVEGGLRPKELEKDKGKLRGRSRKPKLMWVPGGTSEMMWGVCCGPEGWWAGHMRSHLISG
jgi:hypothetical protein